MNFLPALSLVISFTFVFGDAYGGDNSGSVSTNGPLRPSQGPNIRPTQEFVPERVHQTQVEPSRPGQTQEEELSQTQFGPRIPSQSKEEQRKHLGPRPHQGQEVEAAPSRFGPSSPHQQGQLEHGSHLGSAPSHSPAPSVSRIHTTPSSPSIPTTFGSSDGLLTPSHFQLQPQTTQFPYYSWPIEQNAGEQYGVHPALIGLGYGSGGSYGLPSVPATPFVPWGQQDFGNSVIGSLPSVHSQGSTVTSRTTTGGGGAYGGDSEMTGLEISSGTGLPVGAGADFPAWVQQQGQLGQPEQPRPQGQQGPQGHLGQQGHGQQVQPPRFNIPHSQKQIIDTNKPGRKNED